MTIQELLKMAGLEEEVRRPVPTLILDRATVEASLRESMAQARADLDRLRCAERAGMNRLYQYFGNVPITAA